MRDIYKLLERNIHHINSEKCNANILFIFNSN